MAAEKAGDPLPPFSFVVQAKFLGEYRIVVRTPDAGDQAGRARIDGAACVYAVLKAGLGGEPQAVGEIMGDFETDIMDLGPAEFRIGIGIVVEVAAPVIEADQPVVRTILRIGVGQKGARIRHLGRGYEHLRANVAADIRGQVVITGVVSEIRIGNIRTGTLEGTGNAQRHLILDHRRIDDEAGADPVIVADGAGQFQLLVEGRILRLDIDRARHGGAAGERRLRATIDLDLLDVPEASRTETGIVTGLENAIHVKRSNRRPTGDEALGTHAANDEAGIDRRAVEHVGKPPVSVLRISDLAILDCLGGDDADARRRVVPRCRVARAVNGDGIQHRRAVLCGACCRKAGPARQGHPVAAGKACIDIGACQHGIQRLFGGEGATDSGGSLACGNRCVEEDLQSRLCGKAVQCRG
ncbi:hypothetical protein D3C72_865770 [compost metagenome]